MADSTDSDVLMYFISKGTTAIAAESQSTLIASDKLTSDFVAGKFFEAENFTFGIKLDDGEGDKKKKETDRLRALLKDGDRNAKSGRYDDEDRNSLSFARWRSLPDDVIKPDPVFKAEPEDFSVTRMIDSSSPILLEHCLRVQRFEKVVLVKRSRLPSSGALAGFLRMEFYTVYLKSVDWTDGDAVRETCKFKYAGLNVTYIKRKPDGTTASSWPCDWEPATNA